MNRTNIGLTLLVIGLLILLSESISIIYDYIAILIGFGVGIIVYEKLISKYINRFF